MCRAKACASSINFPSFLKLLKICLSKNKFFADIDSLSELKLNRIPGEKLREIEAAAKRYAKNVKQTRSDKGIQKARKYLKDNGLLAVPFDKAVGFCVMNLNLLDNSIPATVLSSVSLVYCSLLHELPVNVSPS